MLLALLSREGPKNCWTLAYTRPLADADPLSVFAQARSAFPSLGCFCLRLVLGLTGLICGIIGVNLAKARDGRGRGQAIAAIPIGAIAALVHVFMLVSL
jgi:hypothetical protein